MHGSRPGCRDATTRDYRQARWERDRAAQGSTGTALTNSADNDFPAPLAPATSWRRLRGQFLNGLRFAAGVLKRIERHADLSAVRIRRAALAGLQDREAQEDLAGLDRPYLLWGPACPAAPDRPSLPGDPQVPEGRARPSLRETQQALAGLGHLCRPSAQEVLGLRVRPSPLSARPPPVGQKVRADVPAWRVARPNPAPGTPGFPGARRRSAWRELWPSPAERPSSGAQALLA